MCRLTYAVPLRDTPQAPPYTTVALSKARGCRPFVVCLCGVRRLDAALLRRGWTRLAGVFLLRLSSCQSDEDWHPERSRGTPNHSEGSAGALVSAFVAAAFPAVSWRVPRPLREGGRSSLP